MPLNCARGWLLEKSFLSLLLVLLSPAPAVEELLVLLSLLVLLVGLVGGFKSRGWRGSIFADMVSILICGSKGWRAVAGGGW